MVRAIKIISPEQFNAIPWKNGKGITEELAISDGDSMNSFDWRLSIASVDEDGVFSDFSGYQRNLILLSGNGIELRHQWLPSETISFDVLDDILSFATFNGCWKTLGLLNNGPISDFNVMHNTEKFEARVEISKNHQDLTLAQADFCFIYPLTEEASLTSFDGSVDIIVKPGHLLQILSNDDNSAQLQLSGANLIVIYLQCLK